MILMSFQEIELAAWRSRFDDAAKEYPDYLPAVQVPLYQGSQALQGGPCIPRYVLRQHGGQWYSCDPKGVVESVLLDDPERLAYAEKDERAFLRFWKLAEDIEPILIEAGVELRDGPDSTPDGRVLYWAIGKTPPANRGAVASIDNAFYLVRLGIQKLLLELGDDPGADLETGGKSDGDAEPRGDDAMVTQGKPSRCPRGMAPVYIYSCLCDHHGFDGERVERWTPITIPEVADRASVSKGSASTWFQKNFESYDLYAAACNREANGHLTSTLRKLSDESISFVDPEGLIENHADQGSPDLVHDLDDPRESLVDPDELDDVQ